MISTHKLVDGYRKAFIDSSIEADASYSPQFVSNSNGKKVLTVIENELKGCDDLFISVAFITMGGIAPLLGTLKDLENKGTKGRILTTDYLMFSDPKALDKLDSLKNIELRVFKTAENNLGFHTKGYMFHNNGDLRIIVGSSNLTQSALSSNHEWNTRLVSTTNGQFAKDVEGEFNSLWESSVCYEDYREEYTEIFNKSECERKEINRLTRTLDLGYSKVLIPNQMQDEFICNIEQIIESGGKRALLISATGTGKTYASAFALRKLFTDNVFSNKKALFISHREQINKQALKSYKRVFGKNVSMELLSGNQNDVDKARSASFLFSTMNMMAKEEVRKQFSPHEYSIIVLDECHRSGSDSYQKIIDYFQPEFLLGMSASPERTDNFDIFSQFDHNIACEIRLQQALENDLLCPFHYFGISDIEIDGSSDDVSKFKQLTSEKRVQHIIERAEYYGYSGDRVKGLIFCSSKNEAQELSAKFNETGKYSTLMLCGDNSQEDREKAIERLVGESKEDQLDYIFTVDIFNEGVDIPEINQVIMLRPTESPIVFVQQLGRGLRKSEEKEFVIVLDFIGNYQNNYMIPIALGGDRTGNKDNIRRSVMEGNNVIKGASTIYFDEISRKRIYASIDSANLNRSQLLKQEYNSLKYKLGRIPGLKEFDQHGNLDPLRIISYSKSYHNFLTKYDTEYDVIFNDVQNKILEFVSCRFGSGMRIHELSLLHMLITRPEEVSKWQDELKEKYKVSLDAFSMQSVREVLSMNFFRGSSMPPALIQRDSEDIIASEEFTQAISDIAFKKELLEIVEFGIYRYTINYSNNYKCTLFNLNKKYTYADVCWLLNWRKEEVAQNIGGYKYDSYTNTFPIFINYDKSEDVSASIRYEDRFIDPTRLIAISKGRRNLASNDVTTIINSEKNKTLIPLFVRKNKDDQTSKEFYFLGTIKFDGHTQQFMMPDTNQSAVEIGYKLDTPVNNNLYEYITEQSI